MRINITRGSEPGGLCRYVLSPDKQQSPVNPSDPQSPEQDWIIASNMGGSTAAELAEEFRFSHDLNTGLSE